ncbi:MAG: IS630 family transposase [Actinomycetota bacterium]
MARKPKVFVRPISDEEGQRLVRITRRSKDPVRLRRAIVVLSSAQGRSVADIASLLEVSQNYVRGVIHDFNDTGFEALDPKWNGGRPRVFDDTVRKRIARIALARPRDLGEPFTCWSLSKLREYLMNNRVVATISTETLRRILAERNITFVRTKTWKESADPDYEAKKNHVLELYDAAPKGGRVICVDEFGPLNLLPRAGRGWSMRGQPRRLRATYTRTHGVKHLFGALDLATGEIIWRIRDRKRWREFLSFLKVLRMRYTEHLYVVCDNFSPHLKGEVATWADANDVELVFVPTNASWLNWIECEFSALRYFALNGSDYASHAEQNAAIGAYLRRRNSKTQPKIHFAVNSKIRPDYLRKVS